MSKQLLTMLVFTALLQQGFAETNILSSVIQQNSANEQITEDTDISSAATPKNFANEDIQSNAPECCTPVKCYEPIIEFKAGYFFFANSKMNEVFDKGGLDLQLSVAYPVWRWLEIYGSVEYLERNGKSLGGNEKTSLWGLPVSLGLRPVVSFSEKFQYYFTLGPRYVYFHAHNDSEYVDRILVKNAFGGFVNTGFYYFPYKHLVFDVFGEYSYVRTKFHPHKTNVFGVEIQVGGFAFGGGIGYAF